MTLEILTDFEPCLLLFGEIKTSLRIQNKTGRKETSKPSPPRFSLRPYPPCPSSIVAHQLNQDTPSARSLQNTNWPTWTPCPHAVSPRHLATIARERCHLALESYHARLFHSSPPLSQREIAICLDSSVQLVGLFFCCWSVCFLFSDHPFVYSSSFMFAPI